MNYNEAYAKLEQCGQLHILKYYHELTQEQQNALLTEIEETDFSVLKLAEKQSIPKRGMISPIPAMPLSEIEKQRQRFEAAGIKALQEGKAAAVLLAGGMGTRLGSDKPKGMYNIGITKELYIFERMIANLMETVRTAGTKLHLFIMTSDKNHTQTTEFFAEKQYFGYDRNYIHFFKQEMAPASDYNGLALMEEKWKIATSPNGNGGWFKSMAGSGMLDIIKMHGIEYLNVFAVDNVLQRIADPVFLGAVIEQNYACGSKVIRKVSPEEKVGVMCLENNHPSIVEYYELTEEMRYEKTTDGDLAYNFGVILNYLFRVDQLESLLRNTLPYHVAEKKIPYIDQNGNSVVPKETNGYKYELFILDMISMLDTCLPFEVVREKEFAPIKNKTGVDSVESAQKLLQQNGIEL
ncbi:MAG: UDPGP type 1 family protein [Lachnospiraceae bacterium]|nr:UDPGP type 1 family protein [Lachnospiraceae bacterium]